MKTIEQIYEERAAEIDQKRKWNVWAVYEGDYTGVLFLGEFIGKYEDVLWERDDVIEAEIEAEKIAKDGYRNASGRECNLIWVDRIAEEIPQQFYDPMHDETSVESIDEWL